MQAQPLTIEWLKPEKEKRWDAFVAAVPGATFFHRAGWKRVIESAFHHQCLFLYAERAGEIEGVLPLVHVNSRLFANALISTPFCVYGGPLASSDEALEALDEAACTYARASQVDYLEMREHAPKRAEWPRKQLYYTFRKPLYRTEEDNLKAIPRKQRAVVRKALEMGLQAEFDHGIERLYPLYAKSVRDLGTPVFSKRYFEHLVAEFGDACEILTITHEGQAVASVLSFYDGNTVMPYYAGAAESARELKAHDFMYWTLICHAAGRGMDYFDFGRSKADTGAYHFKRHWGFDPEPLHYEYYLVESDELPDLSPNNPRYQRAIRAWQKLPVPVTRLIGPMLSRNLG